jgi:calcium uniporter protein, mitochondrial
VLRSAANRKVVEKLEEEAVHRVSVPYSEFEELCNAEGVDKSSAKKLAEALHTSGAAWHFQAMSDTLVLQPEAVTQRILQVLKVGGSDVSQHSVQLKARLDELKAQLEPLHAQYQRIVASGESRANFWINLSLTFLLAQGAAVARLTWWELSWDIMEPVTYMITFATITGGLGYFAATGADYTYEDLHATLARRRRQKLMRRQAFDEQRYQQLIADIEQAESELAKPELSLFDAQLKKF